MKLVKDTVPYWNIDTIHVNWQRAQIHWSDNREYQECIWASSDLLVIQQFYANEIIFMRKLMTACRCKMSPTPSYEYARHTCSCHDCPTSHSNVTSISFLTHSSVLQVPLHELILKISFCLTKNKLTSILWEQNFSKNKLELKFWKIPGDKK